MMKLCNSALNTNSIHLDHLAVIGGNQQWTWRQIHLASLELTASISQASTICNLCSSRLGFLVTWFAGLRNKKLQLLPPSGGHADLSSILRSYSNPIIIVDDENLLQPGWKEHSCFVVKSILDKQSSNFDEIPFWELDWDLPAVCLYTSGSTGAPDPQMRTFGQLIRGAQILGDRINEEIKGGLEGLTSIVCSVPPQHMFGLETSVMFSLVHGIPVLERRPLFPADIVDAFAKLSNGAIWITTPLHLNALASSGDEILNCRAVISSTMILDPVVAGKIETLAKAPVLEIYGSTETGAVATRRTVREIYWRPIVGVSMINSETGIKISGDHFPSPQILSDLIDVNRYGNFKLLGRHGDMIKIAGKRASLAGLNLMLSDLPGLTDGMFYLPTTSGITNRLVIIYSGMPYEKGEIVSWLRDRIDPAFLPRGIIRVDSLKRTENGKVARSVLDKIYSSWQSERVVNESS